MQRKNLIFTAFLLGTLICCNCDKSKSTTQNPPPPPPPPPANEVSFWLTNSDQTVLLQKQSTVLSFSTTSSGSDIIAVDSTIRYQTIDGFGYTLTGGSAYLINTMPPSGKTALMNELFGSGDNSIGVNYLRISLGASDLSASVFSYDDLPTGQTDPTLANFTLSLDTVDLIPLLKEILAINPAIKILASPWSPPVWMKDNGSSTGGSLQPQYYSVYADYFVKYIQAMAAQGITIDAVTPQNEPENPGNNPSLSMTASQEAEFIKNNLGPKFLTAGIGTKIIVWDHNCDNPNYPITILNDPGANQYIDGSAFHLYAGDISALSSVHSAYPTKNLYFTEQYTNRNGTFGGDLDWHIKNVIIGSMQNWSKVALEWNLANDATYIIHTIGGCTVCKGALTISGNSVTRNVGYYIIAHASKFVPVGSARIQSGGGVSLPSVAFQTPSGKKVLIVLNEASSTKTFNIQFKGKWVTTTLNAGSVGTYTW